MYRWWMEVENIGGNWLFDNHKCLILCTILIELAHQFTAGIGCDYIESRPCFCFLINKRNEEWEILSGKFYCRTAPMELMNISPRSSWMLYVIWPRRRMVGSCNRRQHVSIEYVSSPSPITFVRFHMRVTFVTRYEIPILSWLLHIIIVIIYLFIWTQKKCVLVLKQAHIFSLRHFNADMPTCDINLKRNKLRPFVYNAFVLLCSTHRWWTIKTKKVFFSIVSFLFTNTRVYIYVRLFAIE